MQTYSVHGKLTFYGANIGPWKCTIKENTFLDLHHIFEQFFGVHRGQAAEVTINTNSISISITDESSFHLQVNGNKWHLIHPFRLSSVDLLDCLQTVLFNLNGRNVFINITATNISIVDDLVQEVPELQREEAKDDKDVSIEYDTAINTCKIGRGKETCVFTVMGRNGFECSKFNPESAKQLLHKLANNEMNAGRIGECRLSNTEVINYA